MVMCIGRQVPPPVLEGDDWNDLGLVESLTAAYLLFSDTGPGFNFSAQYGLENLTKRGGMGVFWFDRQPKAKVTEAKVRGAARAMLDGIKTPAGDPQAFGVRFVERNMPAHAKAYGIKLGANGRPDPKAVRDMTQQHIDWMRAEGCNKDRTWFSFDFCPDQQTPLQDIPKMIPTGEAGVQFVSLDSYTAASRKPITPEGQRSVAVMAAARDLGLPLVMLECGVCPTCTKLAGGLVQPVHTAVADAHRLADIWATQGCPMVMINSHDWTNVQGLEKWGNGVLSLNKQVQEVLRERLAGLGVIQGPLNHGLLSEIVAKCKPAAPVFAALTP